MTEFHLAQTKFKLFTPISHVAINWIHKYKFLSYIPQKSNYG